MPHRFRIDLGSPQNVAALRIQPRQDDMPNGSIRGYRVSASTDGVNWGTTLAQGDLLDLGAWTLTKTIPIATAAPNRPPVWGTLARQVLVRGTSASIPVQASDPDGDRIAYGATGLPPGLAIDAATGTITGTPLASGGFAATVIATDARGASASAPYLHDGAAPTIAAAIRAHQSVVASDADLARLARYVAEIGDGPAPVAVPAVPGLRGEYFVGVVPGVGTMLLTRNEAVDFDWGAGSPGAGVPADDFAVRWTGTVRAEQTGTFRFRTVSDDGVRLWVNGQLVIDNWTDHGPTPNDSAPIALTVGQTYTIRLEYYERGWGSVIRLQWLRPGISSYEPIPVYVLAPPAATP